LRADERLEKIQSANLGISKLWEDASAAEVSSLVDDILEPWCIAAPVAAVIGRESLLYDAFDSWRHRKTPVFVCFKDCMSTAYDQITTYIKKRLWIQNALDLVKYFG
jgi:hypothetical protein